MLKMPSHPMPDGTQSAIKVFLKMYAKNSKPKAYVLLSLWILIHAWWKGRPHAVATELSFIRQTMLQNMPQDLKKPSQDLSKPPKKLANAVWDSMQVTTSTLRIWNSSSRTFLGLMKFPLDMPSSAMRCIWVWRKQLRRICPRLNNFTTFARSLSSYKDVTTTSLYFNIQ